MNQRTPQHRPTIGVVTISRDEHANVDAFCAHLTSWVDEVIIVDDGSTDGTCDRARTHGDNVQCLVQPRRDGETFADQRMKGIAHATSDWLLHIDMDERVPYALMREIRDAVSSDAYDAYYLTRENFFLNEPVGSLGWRKVRLARREILSFTAPSAEPMHERTHVNAGADRIGDLTHRSWHFGDRSFSERLHKHYQYVSLAAPDTVRWYHFVSQPLKKGVQTYVRQSAWRYGVTGVLFSFYRMTSTVHYCIAAWERHRAARRDNRERELIDTYDTRDNNDAS